MTNKKQKQPLEKDLENKINFEETVANLNFAFCPTFPLKVDNKIKKESGFFNSAFSKKEKQNSEIDTSRYFYICYSFKIDGMDQDYFFFQSFSISQFKFFNSEPLFGFFSKEHILLLISQIDEIFSPKEHQKQIYDSYINEYSSSADYLLAVMAEWTKIKLQHFEYLYLSSEEIQEEIEKLTKQIKEIESKSTVKRKRTPKTEFKTESKTNKNGKPAKPTRPTKPKRSKEAGSSESANGTDKKTNTSKNRSVNSKSNKK